MLRAQVAEGTPLGQEASVLMRSGELVPDRLVAAMLMQRIGAADAADGFILDGFPRNVAQAEILQSADAGRIDRVVVLDVDADEVVRRISGRRCCPSGHIYHVDDRPPARPGVCDEDGERLEQRPDDAEQVVRNRMMVYRAETAPLIEFYGELGLLLEIDGSGAPGMITTQILEGLGA
jgi:adenylate kinase